MFTATVREVLSPISDSLAQLVVFNADLEMAAAKGVGAKGWPDLRSFSGSVDEQVKNLARAAEAVLESLNKIRLGPEETTTSKQFNALAFLLRPTIDLLLRSSASLIAACSTLFRDNVSNSGREQLIDSVRGILHGTARVLDIADRIEVAKIVRLCWVVGKGIGEITGFVPTGNGKDNKWTQPEVERLSTILRNVSDDASSMVDGIRGRIVELSPWPSTQAELSQCLGNLERYWPLLGNAVRCEVEAEISGNGAVQAKGVKHIWARIVKELVEQLGKLVSTDPEGGNGSGYGVLDELKEEYRKLGIDEAGLINGNQKLKANEGEEKQPQPELANKALTKLMGAVRQGDKEAVKAAVQELCGISIATAALAEATPELATNPSADSLRQLALTLSGLSSPTSPESARSLLAHAFALVGQITAVHDQVASYTIGTCQSALFAIEEESESAFENPAKVNSNGKLGENLDAVKNAVDKAATFGLVASRDRDAVIGKVEDLKNLVPIVTAAAQLAAAVSEAVGGTAKEQWDGVKGVWSRGVTRLRETVDGANGIGVAGGEEQERVVIGGLKHTVQSLAERLLAADHVSSPAAAKHALKSLLEKVAEYTTMVRADASRHPDQADYRSKVLADCDALEQVALNVASKAAVLLDDSENSTPLLDASQVSAIISSIKPDIREISTTINQIDSLYRIESRRRKTAAMPTIFESEEDEEEKADGVHSWVKTAHGDTKGAVLDGKEVMVVNALEPAPMDSEQAAREPLKAAAVDLHVVSSKWTEISNPLIQHVVSMGKVLSAIADLQANLTAAVKEGSEASLAKIAGLKKDLLEASNRMIAEAAELSKEARPILVACGDGALVHQLELDLERISTLSKQMKIVSTVKSLNPSDTDADEQMATVARNLVASVQIALKDCEAASLRILPQVPGEILASLPRFVRNVFLRRRS